MEIEEYVQDNVHGRIALTPLESDVRRSPTFRRLLRIQHLGLASAVFPSSSHTRAIHCLGTLHIMGKIVETLKVEEPAAQRLRLAALLHDIGQYPLSHVIEFVYRVIGDAVPADEVAANLEEPELLEFFGRASNSSVPKRTDNWLQMMSWSTAKRTSYGTDKELAKHVITDRPDLKLFSKSMAYRATILKK